MPNLILSVERVTKRYAAADADALTDISLSISPGQLVAILGKSGSGKSTLMNLIAGLDRPSEGTITVATTQLNALSEAQLSAWRGKQVGIIFQFFQLLPTLTALENVILPMEFGRKLPRSQHRDLATGLLASVDLSDFIHRLPEQLSGGQQQRVAVARALANDPSFIIADEPTGNLDQASANTVFDALRACVSRGKTVIVVTHDEDIASQSDRVIRLFDGRVVEDRMLTKEVAA